MEHLEVLEYHLLTNSKPLLKRLFLISLVFLFSPSFAQDFSKTFSFKETLKANLSSFQLLKLDKQKFVRGNYKVSAKIKRMDLLDKDKNFVRRLDTPLKLEGRFIFISQKAQDFYIKVESLDKDIKYEISVNKILDVFYDKKQNEERILSKIIKQTRKDLQSNSSTKEFWQTVKSVGTPLVEKIDENYSLITFLYKGAKHNVRLLGAPSHDHVKLKQLKNSDIWYKSFKVKNGLVLSYQVAPDVPSIKGSKRENRVAILATAQVDPFNKSPYLISNVKIKDKYFKHSSFMLNVKEDKWYEKKNSNRGSLESFLFTSKILNNTRNITVYMPYNYSNKISDYKLLFIFDGIEYQHKIETPLILDNLIHAKKIKPTLAVFIDNISYKIRSSELPTNPKFADFMAKELFPYISKNKAENTVLAGSSYGGLASAYVAFQYPEIFGKVLSLSGSFWWHNNSGESEWLSEEIAKNKTKDITFYLNAGVYETGYFSIGILESNRHLRTLLKAKNYDVIYKEVQGGHDYFSWRISLPDGLISLLNK